MSSATNEASRGLVLIVDDTLPNLRVLSEMLVESGYKVRGAPSGAIALNAARATLPDLVLLDINMPGMNGYEVCRELKADETTSHIPIIFLSALDEALDKVEAFKAGGVDYITKPFQVDEVLIRVDNHMALRRLQKELERANEKLRLSNEDLEERVEKRAAQLVNLQSAQERFVPREFLSFLNKDSILEVEKGDQVQREMTIMFSDIRDFTPLSESMTPQENFAFLNGYLGRISPIIRQHRGFVDKFIGDEIMALFAHSAEDALRAAIAMRQKLAVYNEHRQRNSYVPIDIGTSLHTGNLMLGMIGEEERLEGTVISDAVNLAARLEGMTKIYGASIIISKQTLERLDDPNAFNFRFLDKVLVKGKSEEVDVYEVFDGDPPAVKAAKQETKETYEAAIAAYYDKDFVEARKNLSAILEANPQDKVAQLYLNRAENALSLHEYQITVLLVDDQRIVGEAVRRILAGAEDIEFHHCSDANKALETAEALSPTIILQDLVMPDMDGLSLLRLYRDHAPTRDVPVIVLSVKEDAQTKADAFGLGASDYLIKLPDPIELVARIRHHSKGYINLLERQRTAHSMPHNVPDY